MTRTSGVDLPKEKCIGVGLTYICDIGRVGSNHTLTIAGVNPDTRVRDLIDDEVKKLANIIVETQIVEGDLHREIAMSTKRSQEVERYRRIRHRKSLPVHGQKTRTSAGTCKGLRRTVASKRK